LGWLFDLNSNSKRVRKHQKKSKTYTIVQ